MESSSKAGTLPLVFSPPVPFTSSPRFASFLKTGLTLGVFRVDAAGGGAGQELHLGRRQFEPIAGADVQHAPTLLRRDDAIPLSKNEERHEPDGG